MAVKICVILCSCILVFVVFFIFLMFLHNSAGQSNVIKNYFFSRNYGRSVSTFPGITADQSRLFPELRQIIHDISQNYGRSFMTFPQLQQIIHDFSRNYGRSFLTFPRITVDHSWLFPELRQIIHDFSQN